MVDFKTTQMETMSDPIGEDTGSSDEDEDNEEDATSEQPPTCEVEPFENENTGYVAECVAKYEAVHLNRSQKCKNKPV